MCPAPPHLKKVLGELEELRRKSRVQSVRLAYAEETRASGTFAKESVRLLQTNFEWQPIVDVCLYIQIMADDDEIRYYTQFDSFLAFKAFFDEVPKPSLRGHSLRLIDEFL